MRRINMGGTKEPERWIALTWWERIQWALSRGRFDAEDREDATSYGKAFADAVRRDDIDTADRIDSQYATLEKKLRRDVLANRDEV